MQKIKKLFGQWGMPWTRVLLLAVVTAVYTAATALIPPLDDTSFHDIAVYPEWWILFAVLIVSNCEKWWEASLKCFVFFLVSQPLIYLIQVPFYEFHWQIFRYYRYWFVITLLTLPGAAIAFLLKKKNWLSVPVLTAANALLATGAVRYFRSVESNFPRHLLSFLACVGLIVFFVLVFLDRKPHRIAALVAAAVILLGYAVYTSPERTKEIRLEDGNWTCTVADETIASAEMTDGNRAVIRMKHYGTTEAVFVSDAGEKVTYLVIVSGGGVWLDEFTDD